METSGTGHRMAEGLVPRGACETKRRLFSGWKGGVCRWGKGPEERQLRGQRIEGAGPLSGWSEPWPTDLETRERSQRKGEARRPLPLSMKQAIATHTPENLGTKRWEVEPELKPMSMAPPPKSVRAPGLSPTPSTGLPASLTHVAGPYIVYMLQEIDILEDWTAIKKVGLVLRCPHSLRVGLAVQVPPPAPASVPAGCTCELSEDLAELCCAPAFGPGSLASLPAHSLLLPKAALEEGTSSLPAPFLL